MGLLKRLVIALETIAAKKEDYEQLNKIVDRVILSQKEREKELRKEQFDKRFMYLDAKFNSGAKMTANEKAELKMCISYNELNK